jgi:hypothetical protein
MTDRQQPRPEPRKESPLSKRGGQQQPSGPVSVEQPRTAPPEPPPSPPASDSKGED